MSGWLWYAFLAMMLWGLWGVCSKIAAGRLPVPVVFLVESWVYLVIGGLIWWQRRAPFDWDYPGLAAAGGAGIAGGVAMFFFLKALSTGPAAVIVPLTSLYPVITVILGVAFLQESLTLRHLAGIILAMAAAGLLAE